AGERRLFPGLLARGAGVHAPVDSPYWRDLGAPAAFVRGSADLVRGLVPSPVLPGPVGEALLLPGARAHADAHVTGGSVVGAGCVVRRGARVIGSVLMDRADIGPDARVEPSVIGARGQGGERAGVHGAVAGAHAGVGARWR